MSAGVIDPVESRREISAGRIVDRVHRERPCACARPQRIDESLADLAEARRLRGTAGEHNFDIGARLG